MICVIIPTYNAAEGLASLLAQLQGKADRIVVADGGSADGTIAVATRNAFIAAGAKGRGQQLALGASWAEEAEWLLFLHADNRLPEDWREMAEDHIAHHPGKAAYFRFRAETPGFWPRFMDAWVGFRCWFHRLPYGDQGLLISRAMYDSVGGYPAQPLFEDVAIIEAIKAKFGGKALRPIAGHMIIDMSKYERDGYSARGRANARRMKAYRRGVDIGKLAVDYK